MILDDFATENIACEHCGAKPGIRCRTRTGRRATYVHYARTFPVSKVWTDGYLEGRNEILDAVIDDTSPVWLQRSIERRRQERGLA